MGNQDLVSTITNAIADAEGVPPEDLDYVLQDHVEVDAIRALARHPDSSWTLSFEIPDHTVTVDSDGAVLVGDDHRRSWK